jgi:hypothetical protein
LILLLGCRFLEILNQIILKIMSVATEVTTGEFYD